MRVAISSGSARLEGWFLLDLHNNGRITAACASPMLGEPLRGILNPTALQFDTISCPLFVAHEGTPSPRARGLTVGLTRLSTELLFHLLLIYDHVRFPAVQQAQRGSAVIPLFRRPRDFTGVLSGDNNWKVESLNWFICSIDFWWVFVLFFFSLFLSFFLFVNIGSGKWNNVISRDMIYYISINIVWTK